MRDCHVTNTRFRSGFPFCILCAHTVPPATWILMATVSPCCFLCSASLGFPTKRRVISPVSEVNADIHEFLVTAVRPGHQFGSKVAYVCRMPCFSNLTKAVKHHVTLRDLMLSFGAPIHAHIKTTTSDASTQTDNSLTSLPLTGEETPPTGVLFAPSIVHRLHHPLVH